MDISKTSIKTKEKGKKRAVANTQFFLHKMSRQPDSHFRMANHLSHIGYLIKGPTVNRSGLGDLLWHIQWEPPQNLHPTTKEICKKIIHYITDGATNDEQSTYNKNMELLSVTLEDITKIIESESRQMRIDLLNLYLKKGKRSTTTSTKRNGQYDQNNNSSNHRPPIQQLKSQNTTTHNFSKRRRGSTSTKRNRKRRGKTPPLNQHKTQYENTSESKTRSPCEQHLQ